MEKHIHFVCTAFLQSTDVIALVLVLILLEVLLVHCLGHFRLQIFNDWGDVSRLFVHFFEHLILPLVAVILLWEIAVNCSEHVGLFIKTTYKSSKFEIKLLMSGLSQIAEIVLGFEDAEIF